MSGVRRTSTPSCSRAACTPSQKPSKFSSIETPSGSRSVGEKIASQVDGALSLGRGARSRARARGSPRLCASTVVVASHASMKWSKERKRMYSRSASHRVERQRAAVAPGGREQQLRGDRRPPGGRAARSSGRAPRRATLAGAPRWSRPGLRSAVIGSPMGDSVASSWRGAATPRRPPLAHARRRPASWRSSSPAVRCGRASCRAARAPARARAAGAARRRVLAVGPGRPADTPRAGRARAVLDRPARRRRTVRRDARLGRAPRGSPARPAWRARGREPGGGRARPARRSWLPSRSTSTARSTAAPSERRTSAR